MRMISKRALALAAAAAALTTTAVMARTVEVTMTAREVDHVVDNKGSMHMAAWTFDGTIPGKVVRVDEGDTVDFKLINPPENKNSHAMDFHAAQADVLGEFAQIKPG